MYSHPMLLSCAILAFSRKNTRIAVIWPLEMELLTGTPFIAFKALYELIESRYYECFPDQIEKQPTSTTIRIDKSSS